MKYIKIPLTFLFAGLLTPAAFAADEGLHLLTVGEGIASPSVTTTLLGQNPAGLGLSEETHLQGVFADNNDDTSTYGAFFHFGGDSVAGAVGAISRSRLEEETASPGNNIYLGLAFKAAALNTSFGLGGRIFGRYNTSDDSYDRTNDLDFGILYGTEGPLKIGLTIFGILDNEMGNDALSTRNIGVGIGYEVSDTAIVALDARLINYNYAEEILDDLQVVFITPGVKVALDSFQVSFSYRMVQSENEGAETIDLDGDDLLLGFGVAFTSNFAAQLQSNRLGEYDAGLTYIF